MERAQSSRKGEQGEAQAGACADSEQIVSCVGCKGDQPRAWPQLCPHCGRTVCDPCWEGKKCCGSGGMGVKEVADREQAAADRLAAARHEAKP